MVKKILYHKFFYLLFCLCLIAACQQSNNTDQPEEIDLSSIKQKSVEALQYCKEKNLNEDFFFLIDLNRHSGLKRFYVWNFHTETVENAFLVSHGCGPNPWGNDDSKTNPFISNVPDSHASSVGKYIVKGRGWSNWGIHVNYKLEGKDHTNSNAKKREIVLHSWERISDDEVYPAGTPEGWGCPAVSDNSMRVLDEKLRNKRNDVLLWIVK